MADTDFYTKKPPKIISTTTSSSSDQVMTADNHAASKYFNQFLIKAVIVTIFLVILPLLPSQAPEFINQNLHAGSWELLQLIFVGIAVSYGLFSKRNDDDDIFCQSDKEQNNSNNHRYSKVDTAHSYVSTLLQVSSVFDDDEAEIHSSTASDDNKVQTWNSRYYREEPDVVVVPKEKSVLEKQNSGGIAARIDEKPLLLPVRSLKSRVIETNNESETVRPESASKPNSVSRSNSNLGSKRYSGSNSRKSRNGESRGGGASQAKVEENIEENVVHRSPIPWRSRSGRFEMKKEDSADADAETELLGSYLKTPKMENSDSRRMESRSFRSSNPNSAAFPCSCPSPNKPSPPTTTPSSPTVIQSPLTYFSSESQTKSVEDVATVRKKVHYKSSPPPPPPPPPPPFLQNKCLLTKSKSSLSNISNYPQKEMRRSIRSVPSEFSETEIESPLDETPSLLLLKSVRTIRQSEPPVTKKSAAASVTTREFFDENDNIIENRGFTDKMMNNNNKTPNFKRQNFTELFPAADEEEEEKREVIEKILLETDNDDDEDSITESEEDDYFDEVLGSSGTEEPADVDKKADEFIAKFREQIRLQRIESIRRSAGQLSRNRPR